MQIVDEVLLDFYMPPDISPSPHRSGGVPGALWAWCPLGAVAGQGVRADRCKSAVP
jgi:hypothetical protein